MFAEDDIHPIAEEISRNCASFIRKCKFVCFKNLVSFNALLEHELTHELESHQTSNLNDVHINMEQKQLTTPDCMNNISLQPHVLGKMQEVQLNGSG